MLGSLVLHVQLTARLSSLPGSDARPGHVSKLPVTDGYAGFISGYFGFTLTTDCSLTLTTFGFESRSGHVSKLPVTSG